MKPHGPPVKIWIRISPTGSWIWKLSHQGVTLLGGNTSYSWVIEHEELKLIINWKPHSCWLAFIMVYACYQEKSNVNSHTALQTTLTSYLERFGHWYKGGTNVFINQSLFYLFEDLHHEIEPIPDTVNESKNLRLDRWWAPRTNLLLVSFWKNIALEQLPMICCNLQWVYLWTVLREAFFL